ESGWRGREPQSSPTHRQAIRTRSGDCRPQARGEWPLSNDEKTKRIWKPETLPGIVTGSLRTRASLGSAAPALGTEPEVAGQESPDSPPDTRPPPRGGGVVTPAARRRRE